MKICTKKKELIEKIGVKAILLFELKDKIDELRKKIAHLNKKMKITQSLQPVNYNQIVNLEHTLYYAEKKLEEMTIRMNQITRNLDYNPFLLLFDLTQVKTYE